MSGGPAPAPGAAPDPAVTWADLRLLPPGKCSAIVA